MARTRRSNIRRDLLEQLKAKGMGGSHFIDMADDYMSLYDQKLGLLADLKERGSTVSVESPKGVFNTKVNPSLAVLLKVNRSMMDILKGLGLNEPDGVGGDEL